MSLTFINSDGKFSTTFHGTARTKKNEYREQQQTPTPTQIHEQKIAHTHFYITYIYIRGIYLNRLYYNSV